MIETNEVLSKLLSGRTIVSKENLGRKAIISALKFLDLKINDFTGRSGRGCPEPTETVAKIQESKKCQSN